MTNSNKRSFRCTLKPSLVLILASIVFPLILANIEGAKVHRRTKVNAVSKLIDDYGDDDYEYSDESCQDDEATIYEPRETDYCKGLTCDYQDTCGRAENNPLTPEGDQKGYVWGGKDAIPGAWPSFVRLSIQNGTQWDRCGGVLISNSHVLTAARCVYDNIRQDGRISVVMGEYDTSARSEYEQRREVPQVCTASNFWTENGERFYNDYALLTLDSAVEFSKLVQPACLPPRSNLPTHPATCYFVGHGFRTKGKQYPNKLQVIEVRRSECVPKQGINNNDMTRWCFRKLGHGGEPCDGDAGGPILCLNHDTSQWTVVGLMSYGPSKCFSPDDTFEPTVYTRIPTLLDLMNADCGI